MYAACFAFPCRSKSRALCSSAGKKRGSAVSARSSASRSAPSSFSSRCARARLSHSAGLPGSVAAARSSSGRAAPASPPSSARMPATLSTRGSSGAAACACASTRSASPRLPARSARSTASMSTRICDSVAAVALMRSLLSPRIGSSIVRYAVSIPGKRDRTGTPIRRGRSKPKRRQNVAGDRKEATMILRAFFIPCAAVLGTAACAAQPQAAGEAVREGLVAVQSRNLDELYLRPNADLAAYRKVLIDPVRAEIRGDWQKNLNYTRNVSRWVGPDDAQRIAADVASTLESTLAETYKARGYEIAAAPEPGVLRLSASIADLYVNAPDRFSPWTVKTFTRDAGQATLLLEARDAVTGALLARVVHHAIAREISRINMANDLTNRFWFDTLFRRWTADCIAEFEAGRNRS